MKVAQTLKDGESVAGREEPMSDSYQQLFLIVERTHGATSCGAPGAGSACHGLCVRVAK